MPTRDTLELLDAIPGFGHWITDHEGKILRSRGSALALVGLQSAQIEGTSVFDKDPLREDRYKWGDESVEIFRLAQAGNADMRRSVHGPAEAQRTYYQAWAPLYTGGEFTGMVVVYADITGQRQRENTRLMSLLERFMPKLELLAEEELRELTYRNDRSERAAANRDDLAQRLKDGVQGFCVWLAPKMNIPAVIVGTAGAIAFAVWLGVLEPVLSLLSPAAKVVQVGAPEGYPDSQP